MSRYLYIVLFVIVLVTPFIVRLVVAKRADDRPSGNDANAPELVIVTPHNQDIRRVFEHAFLDWHQKNYRGPVRITYLTPGGTNDITRFIADVYGAQGYRPGTMPPEQSIQTSVDLVWGGGDVTFERELKPFLEPVKLPPEILRAAFPQPDLNGVPLYERTKDGSSPKWVGIVLSSFGIVYNPSLYETLNLPPPQRWDDLARPELAGFVALADPTRSGSAAMTYMMVLQRAMADAEEEFFATHPKLGDAPKADVAKRDDYRDTLGEGWKQGMRVLVLAAANARYFTDSATQVPNDVGNGDAAAGVAIDFYGRVFQQEIGRERITYIAPRGATAITPDPIGVLYGVRDEREVLANRFIEFLLTADAQRLWNLEAGHTPYVKRSLRRLPIRRDVYGDRTGWADASSNPFEESSGFNVRGEWMGVFGDTRPVWGAAWIDSRQALKDAYATILEVPDPSRRADLLLELSDLPITMKDVEAQQKRRKQIEARQDPEESDARLWMTKRRVQLADDFREHYRTVAAKADASR